MPELPEVETVRRGLSRFLSGLTFQDVKISHAKSFSTTKADINKFLIDATVLDVQRRAKILIINLSSHYSLLIHLKMTGQLVFERKSVRFGGGHPGDSLINKLPDRTTRVTFEFTDQSRMYFNDQRKFGWIRLWPTLEIPDINFMQQFGPEPLESDFSWQVLKKQLQRRPKSTIKAALLDQTVIAGIGNIYADESLWAAKIHPKTPTYKLSDLMIRQLYKSIIDVLNLSLRKGGSTDRNYVDAEGHKGSYLTFAKVFRRDGLACPRCGTLILKNKVAGRGTHFCPFCQRQLV